MKAQASPNIAFIKYWGKLPATSDDTLNIPVNPSISMTLSRALTTTSVTRKTSGSTSLKLNGTEASTKDLEKVSAHIQRVCRFLKQSDATAFDVESRNNFPQGTGLASSASAFTALTLATIGELIGHDRALEFQHQRRDDFSRLARQGSGSACRSVDGGYLKWVNDCAAPIDLDWKLRDTVLIFSKEHKKVPSTEGHAVALSSPKFAARLEQIPARMKAVEDALFARKLSLLGPMLELEALELHEIAATGTPSITYLTPESRSLVEHLSKMPNRDFYFTLDAGPNVHILSERDVEADLRGLLSKLQLKAEIWKDETGEGPRLLP